MVIIQYTGYFHDYQVFAAAMSSRVGYQPSPFTGSQQSTLKVNLIDYQLQTQSEQTRLPRI
jgi:hypothetical protein